MQGVYDYDRGISAVDVLMARCPNATLTVHPRGARHVIDPSHLLAATIGVYGEREARRMYGEVRPQGCAKRRILTEGERQRRPPSAQELRRVFGLDIELNAQGLEARLDATARNNAN